MTEREIMITFKPLSTWSEALAVSRLRNQSAKCFTNYTGTISPLRQWLWFHFTYSWLCRSGRYRVWIARVDGQIVGYGALADGKPPRCSAHYLTATECVDDRFRQMGVGSAIVACLLEQAKAEFRFVSVDIWADNTESIRLHTRKGFRPFSRRMLGSREQIRMVHLPWE